MQNDFVYILNKYQSILNIFRKYEIKKGICEISQTRIANELKMHPSNISHSFKTINYEGEDIQKIKPGLYRVNTFDVNELSTFKKVRELLIKLNVESTSGEKREKDLAKEYNCNVKTIQLAKAILRGTLKKKFTLQ